MSEIFSCILKLSVDASYLIVAVILARLLLRKSSKVFRKILWVLVGLRLSVPISFESVLSLVPQTTNVLSNETLVGGNITSVPTQAAATESFDFLQILPVVWAVVAVGLLIYGLISFIRLKRKISDAVLLEDNIYQSEKVDSPFVCGFIKPKIYIPYDMDSDTFNCVIKHEKTHIKCLDHILKALGFGLLCVHWFNPLVWVGYILFCKDIELLCDEIVVKDMTEENRKKYALALCNIGVEKVKISACPVAFGEVGIKERVKNTVNFKKVKSAILIISAVACVVVAVCFMTTPVKAQEEKTEPKPEETTLVVETTEPVTVPETVPVIETVPVTEVSETTESVIEKERVTETVTELYIENDGANKIYDVVEEDLSEQNEETSGNLNSEQILQNIVDRRRNKEKKEQSFSNAVSDADENIIYNNDILNQAIEFNQDIN
ncbi:MAG: hypothetical protein J6A49_05845 [Clostridia bacterium]|nr:hypothetical protein [Clostridia bacterium]